MRTSYYSDVEGDYNGDGLLDLLIFDKHDPTTSQDSGTQKNLSDNDLYSPSVYLNDGKGHFPVKVASNVVLVGSVFVTVIGDFNNDEKTDVIVGRIFYRTSEEDREEGFYTLLGNGDGTFSNPKYQILSDNRSGVYPSTAIDLNHDGSLDLVTDHADILYGRGDGSFDFSIPLNKNLRLSGVSGDFDENGYLDFANRQPYGGVINDVFVPAAVQILLYQADRGFSVSETLTFEKNYLNNCLAGDFNQDQQSDLIVIHTPILITPNDLSNSIISVYLSQPPPKPPLGDLNNNGAVDLKDVLLVLNLMVNSSNLSESQIKEVDINEDGKITIADAVLLLRKTLGF